MKKIIAYIPTYLLYYIGDIISKSFIYKYLVGYKIYSWFMWASSNIQDWAKLSKPWSDPKNAEY